MTATQARFRRLVALYPAGWQAEHGEAYLGLMLDVAEAEGRTGPVAREGLSALRHAAAAWAGELGRRLRADDGLRQLGLTGAAALVSGTTVSLLALVLGEWAPTWLLPADLPSWWSQARLGRTTGIPLFGLWLVVLAAVVLGRAALARRLLGVAAVAPTVLYLVRAAGGPDRPPAGVLLALTVFAVLATALPDPTPCGRRVLLALGVLPGLGLTALLVGAWALSPHRPDSLPPLGFSFYRGNGLPLLAPVVVVAVLAGCALSLALVRRRPHLLVAVGLVGSGWLWLVLSAGRFWRGPVQFATSSLTFVVVLVAPGLLAAAVGVATAARRVRSTAA